MGETTEMTGKPRTGLWLKIRLEMLSSVVSWFPPRGVVENDREMTETTGKQRKRRGTPKNDQSLNACNFLNNGPIFNL